MAILAKPINPKKFNDKAFLQEFETEARRTAKDMKKDFQQTVKTWKRKPTFEMVVAVGPKSIDILVGTDDEIYGYVDKGTAPHLILPKKPGGKLRFQSNYKAKTIPNVIGSRSGGSSGNVVFSDGVIHPGTEARNFDKIIAKKWEPIYKRRIEQALSRANKKSGHAYP